MVCSVTIRLSAAAQKLDPKEDAFLPAPKSEQGRHGMNEGILSVKLHQSEGAEAPGQPILPHVDPYKRCYSTKT